ncbi:MAG TPA: histidinol-phosphate transaminase [Candidatus Thiothrix moscowensis]|uniref:histidinol-phosphate transaminase n=1 Tax=unclassified Thiothrix TaxID=2636184 RepID=UPI0025EBAE22|nr:MULTISPECIES: histidinol-phosphate transaminase [unclassified Thiothrix]HRJ53904.1 histidinol-phosphate transaminase [Candidatus Thiothrix moscowensis]HRJ93986.1 histidinol-phosphate transaminase [Candidatus Thiothrix moscowensis]
MSQYWSKLVHDLDPYVPGEQPKDQRYIKLNTNECPYPPSPAALAAIHTAADDTLRLYPDPNADVLKDAIAEHYAVDRANVFVGNGSDEVLAHVFHGLLKHEKPLLFPDISYSFYPVYANLYQIEAQQIPLRDDFRLCLGDYAVDNGGIIFPNPNAPTSMAVGLEAIEALLQTHPDSVVVVDEAYIDFGGETAIPLTATYPNLLVVQTFSKSRSLAGLRVGFAVGHTDLINALERVKNSFNSYPLGRMAIAGAAAAMRDKAYFETMCQRIIATRENTVQKLTELGFTVLPSAANFVFARPPAGNAEAIYLALKQRGVLVRYFNKPRINEYLRITIGTDEEMAAFLQVLSEL